MGDVYRKYADMVYWYLLSLTHDSHIAEELTQETFYQAIRSSGKYDGSCKISTWLCAIAKNVLLTYRRKYPPHEELSAIDTYPDINSSDGSLSAEDQALSSACRVELLHRLHLLSDPFREVLYLRIFGDLSFREIGEIFEKSENWARVTFYRGKEKLRAELKKNNMNNNTGKDANDHE